MGCDIHIYSEFKRDGKWWPGEAWFEKDEYGEGPRWTVNGRHAPYRWRDYCWFAFLCGVRSGTWGNNEHPQLSEPKGLPNDVSDRLRDESDRWDSDGHSHSWFTLAELETYYKQVKDQKIWFEAVPMMTDEELSAWLLIPEDKRPAPLGFSQSSFSCGKEKPKHRWCETVHALINPSYGRIREYLWNLKWDENIRDDNDVRMVFWFDN